ncbi:Polyadenylate-binding protein 4 [Glugoides intestinalis]
MDSGTRKYEAQTIVYCGNLPLKTSVAELIALFSQVAPIVHIKLVKKDGNSISTAFVTFQSLEDANKIVEKFNYHTIHNKQMILSIVDLTKNVPEDANLFVKGIPVNMSFKDFYKLFKVYGNITSCKISTNEKGESKGFGFVQYDSSEAADKATKELHNTKVETSTLLISKYDKSFRSGKSVANQAKPTNVFNNIYIKNFPKSMTEERLKEMFEKYGKIVSVYFPLNEDSKTVGFACINFESPESAVNAIAELHGKQVFPIEEYPEEVISPTPFYIQKFEKKKERQEEIIKKLEGMSIKGMAQSKSNLYVSGIPEAFTINEIKELFEKYGEIESIKLQKPAVDSLKQFGYICFKRVEDASEAYEKLDNTLLDNSRLQISYYKPKIERSMDIKQQKGSFSSKDNLPSQGISKLVQSLVNTVEKTASLYKEDWSAVQANSSAEFSQKMAREFFSMSEADLKEMISASKVLEKKIKNILKTRKQKCIIS